MRNHGLRLRHATVRLLVTMSVSVILVVCLFQDAHAPPPPGWRDAALDYAESQHMFGPLSLTAGGTTSTYSGAFVSFRFNETDAAISEYIVLTPGKTTMMFQSISPDTVASGTIDLNGSTFEYSSSVMEVAVYNNPTSALILKPGSLPLYVTFTVPPGVDASRDGQALNLVSLSTGIEARLQVTGNSNLTLLGSQALARITPGNVATFRAKAVSGEGVAGGEGQSSIVNATISNLLAIESFQVALDGYIESSDVPYDDVAILESNLTSTGIEMGFEKSGTIPRLIALHIHKSVMNVDNKTQLVVRLDGLDILNFSDLDTLVAYSGSGAGYSIIFGNNGLLVLIRVPAPGIHAFSISIYVPPPPPPLGPNPIQILSIVAIIVVIVMAAALFMFRRRSSS